MPGRVQAQQLPPNEAACWNLGSWAGGKEVSISLYSVTPTDPPPVIPSARTSCSIRPVVLAAAMPCRVLRYPQRVPRYPQRVPRLSPGKFVQIQKGWRKFLV